MSYEANFTQSQILLAILKLTANNNAMLQISIENQLEIRKDLLKIETLIEHGSFNQEMQNHLKEFIDNVRNQLNELKSGVESGAFREAYEWAFMNDPDSLNLDQFD